MTLSPHRVPADVFTALAEGGGGAAAVGLLGAAQRSKQILLVRRVLDAAEASGHPRAGAARQAYALLAAVQERSPAAADAVLRHPAVEGWARAAVAAAGSGPGEPGPADPARLAALAAAAAVRAGHPCAIDVPVVDGAVVLPSLGRAEAGAGAGSARLTVDSGGAELVWPGGRLALPADPHSDAPGWHGLRRLRATAGGRTLQLLIDDVDPFRMPGSQALGERLDAAEAEHWRAAFADAWTLVVTGHPELAEEVAAAIRVLTPLTPPPGGHVSATSRETFGTIALSTPVDGCALAVAFAHETQHAKLSALLDVVPMTLPDDGRRHYAPWREDPRPIAGLLQGCYAFLGVAGFWLRQAEYDDEPVSALAEFVRWRDAVRLGLDTLRRSGRLTGAGESFVAGMDRTVAAWAGIPVPPTAGELAERALREHRERWTRDNGPIESLV